MAQSAFDPETMQWQLAWPGRVARHDLVYASPPEDPTQGVPLGNGDVGVLVWCDSSRVVMAVNKCDLFDDPTPQESLRNWSPEQEELSPTQRHAGRIIIDFRLPVFDPFYLSDFEARLSLSDATFTLHASGPLGTVDLRAFVDHQTGVLCASARIGLSEPVVVELVTQRYGSRTFGHWYSQVKRDPSVGLSGTAANVAEGVAVITQELSTGLFALGSLIDPTGGSRSGVEHERRHSRAIATRLPEASKTAFDLYAAVTSPMNEDSGRAIDIVRDILSVSTDRGIDALHASHAGRWQAFWLRSLMESGDDYLDNLWHLTMYYANASQSGRFPGRFIFGQWGWNRDVQHWTFYFHWNQQQVYWPLNAAGHHDLLSSYLEYRFNSLPYAREDARRRLNAPGAMVCDVADWHGRNSVGEMENHMPVAQIALEFWRQYLYTGDRRFLEERAHPYLVDAAAFFETLFERGDDGLYHGRGGTGYEGWILMRDVITELASGQSLFAAALEALRVTSTDDPRASRWRDILDHMSELPSIRPEGCFEVAEGQTILARGLFKGRQSYGEETLAAGWGVEDGKLLTSKVPVTGAVGQNPEPYTALHRLETNETLDSAILEDMKIYDGIFPSTELSAVFPSGLIGLSQRGTKLFDLAANTALLYAPDCMGWDPLPIVLARLGLADELDTILAGWPSRWQYHCNGFGHYGPRDIQKAEAALRFRTNVVRDADAPSDKEASFPFSMWPFRHMGMESMSVLSCAMNESMLQSHDGVIRVGPAAQTARPSARFTLHAAGGFVVSAELAHGRPLWVALEALRGGECRVENPWEEAFIRRNGDDDGVNDDRLITIPTVAGDRFLLTPDRRACEEWVVAPEDTARNEKSKRCPRNWAQLGLPRMF